MGLRMQVACASLTPSFPGSRKTTGVHGSICKCFEDRRGESSVEDGWKELQKTMVDPAEEHLHRTWPKQRRWISEGTLEMIEHSAWYFSLAGRPTEWGNCKEYVDLCKKVRRKVWDDKEK